MRFFLAFAGGNFGELHNFPGVFKNFFQREIHLWISCRTLLLAIVVDRSRLLSKNHEKITSFSRWKLKKKKKTRNKK